MQKVIVLFFSFILHQLAFAQQEQKIEITKNLFIKDALIVAKPESSPIKQSLIIRDGLITQIGAELKAPFDCKIILADSLYLYAGFIDVMSHTGIKKEEENKDTDKPASRGEANYEQSGITPQVEALSKFSLKESSIADMRKTGFTTSHIFPRGKMMAGKSTLVSLGISDIEDKLVLKNNLALHSSFTTANGVYPSTIIGVFAKYRDVYKNVEIYSKNKAAYDLNPLGISRPIFSEELNALISTFKKEQTVYFVTKNIKETYRALELQKEIGFKMVLAEVKNVTSVLDKIKSNNFPVLLSLDLPEEIKEDKKSDTTKVDSIKKELKKEISIEMKQLEERKKISYNEYLSQASLLEKNNITFSFSYLESKPGDIMKSLRRYIKAGLSEKGALAALTTTPAQLLNINTTHGTVEIGKTANLVIAQKPIFDEKSSIKYVIVDGKLYEYYEDTKNKESKGERSKKSFEGIWSYTGQMEGQTQSGTIEFKKEGEKYKASIKSDNFPDQIFKSDDVEVNGNKIDFTFIANIGQPTDIKVTLEIDKDELTGNIEVGGIGNIKITGDKKSNPDKNN